MDNRFGSGAPYPTKEIRIYPAPEGYFQEDALDSDELLRETRLELALRPTEYTNDHDPDFIGQLLGDLSLTVEESSNSVYDSFLQLLPK